MSLAQIDISRIPPRSEVLIELDRRKCATLSGFAKQAWHVLEPGADLKWGWVLDAICEHLEAVSHGDIKRLLMNVPPGSMKSLLTSVIFPAWEWGPQRNQGLRFLGTAHAAHLAVRDNLKCRRLIQSSWYQERWPVVLTGDQNAKTKFENDKTGFREAMSFEGMTGSRGDRVIIDDPHSVADANSVVKLDSGIRTFREALPSRVNNDKSAIVIIMQRLHERDVSAVALELGYDHLCVPMRYEEPKTATRIGWVDPRSVAGELMFPDRFPEGDVKALELSLGSYATAGQLQQRPNPAGGGIFKNDWWQYLDVAPPLEWRAIYADTAQKTKEQNDYTVFQCWGKTRNGQAILLDMVRGKFEAPELLERARAFWAKHSAAQGQGTLRAFKIEDKVSGTGLIQQLKREGKPVLPIQRATDKLTRAYDAAPYIESGNVILLRGVPHLSDMLAEAEALPNGAHDDTLDPMMDAIADIIGTPKSSSGILIRKR
jgi:predicted phage terminase large subunit-like protein